MELEKEKRSKLGLQDGLAELQLSDNEELHQNGIQLKESLFLLFMLFNI